MDQLPERVTQTVILAAGLGARLNGGADASTPKPLLTVAGLPLVAHALDHAAASGCAEAIVVIGHEGDRVRAAVEGMHTPLAVRFVVNPDPRTPNGESLLVAEPFVDGRFFLQMVDHLFAEPVLGRLAGLPLANGTAARVLVDRAPVDLDLSDATKVRVDGDRVMAIGKAVDPWDAIDAGCFLLTRRIFEALRAVRPDEPRTVSSAMRRLVDERALAAGEIGPVRWVDVDTPADRASAERLFSKNGNGRHA